MTSPESCRTASVVLAERTMNGWGLRAPLEALGHRIIGQAEDGVTAAELVARLRPDLAVLDLHLRGAGGLEAAARLRGTAEAGLVFVAAEWDPASLELAVAAGALACLTRPVGVEQLGLSLLVALERRAELVTLRAERAELEQKLAAGKLAVQAKGILMRRLGVGEDAAHLLLHHRARRTRRPVLAAAQEVLAADQFFAELERSLESAMPGPPAARTARLRGGAAR